MEIRVPLKKGGSEPKEKKSSKAMDKLTSAVTKGNVLAKILHDLLGGLAKILAPLTKVLGLLFTVIFLPLMPIILQLTEAIISVIEGLLKLFGGEITLAEFMREYLAPALVEIIQGLWAAIWSITEAIGLVLWETIKMAGEVLWEVLKWLGRKIGDFGRWLWDKLVKVWSFYLGLPLWIWNNILQPAWIWIAEKLRWPWDNLIKPAWEWLVEKIKSVWDGLKGAFDYVKNKLKGWGNSLKSGASKVWGNVKSFFGNDTLIRSNGDMVHLNPEDNILAMKDFGKLGGGGVTINVNNPVVREERDIKKMTDQISRELSRRGHRGMS